MKIEVLNIEELKPLEKNVRRHNDKQIDELIRSLNQFGQTRAIVIDEENNILIGNGLYAAMKKRGDTKCEVYRKTGLSEKDKKKLILTDNRVYSLGADDYTAIQDFIDEITLEGDFDIAGFDDDVIKQMTKDMNAINDDVMNYGNIPASPSKPQGQVISEEAKPQETYNQPSQSHNEEPPVKEAGVSAAQVQNERTIVCPNCGEVIHLD